MKNRVLFLIAVLLLLIPFANVAAQDQAIADVIAGDAELSTLAQLVQAAGLAETLAGAGPYTVFAPTNDAIAALPAPVVEYLTSAAGADTLAQIVNYHVVSGATMLADLQAGDLASAQGDPITVTVGDAGAAIENAGVVAADVAAANGVIHKIDAVLLPTIQLPEVDPLAVEGDLVTAGSSTVFPLSRAIADQFINDGYTGNVTVDSIGTGAGFERFCQAGETDISNASRAIRQEEIDACAALNPPRTPAEFRVGTDGLAIVVSSANDFVQDVTTDEVKAIFSTATNWSDVRADWPNEPILRFTPGTDSGTFDYFVEHFYDEDEAPLLNAGNLQLSEDDNVLVQGVESSPYAIGFFGYAYYQEAGDQLRAVAIDGVAPSAETVEAGDYSLARPLFIYSDAGVMTGKPQVADFINYYLTNVDAVIDSVGYFKASDAALNLAKLNFLAATANGM
jgi:phosphate transport system substrate-binding protein